jgi:transposase
LCLDGTLCKNEAGTATAAAADPEARRLMTHPGVGPLTALATVLVLGPVGRFPGSKHVISYIGLAAYRQRIHG